MGSDRSRIGVKNLARSGGSTHSSRGPRILTNRQTREIARVLSRPIDLHSISNQALAGVLRKRPADAPVLETKDDKSPAGSEKWTAAEKLIYDLAVKYGPRKTGAGLSMRGVSYIIGPLEEKDAAELLALTGTSLEQSQKDATGAKNEPPPLKGIELIYTNDGTGIFPNFGGGSDQGLTASVALQYHYDNKELGLTRAGKNLQIWTPQKGGAPIDGVYPGGEGGYKGLLFADFEYRVKKSGASEVLLLTEIGINGEELGNLVQSEIVHKPLGIPLFKWSEKSAEFYGSLGAKAQTFEDLFSHENFAGGTMRLRLIMSADAKVGTHGSSGGSDVKLVLTSGHFKLKGVGGSAEISVGAGGHLVARYRDRGGTRAGVEGTISNEFKLNIDQIGPVLGKDAFLPGSLGLSLGGRSTKGTLGESLTPAGEDNPAATGAWAGPGSHSEGIVKLTWEVRF